MSAERIGNLLASLDPREPILENNQCGGALLYVTRKQAVAMAESGRYRWVSNPERIPEEGRHSWRIACRNDVQELVRTAEAPPDATPEQKAALPRFRVKYGLCVACSGLEIGMRKHLAKEKKQAEEQAQAPAGRRRGFRENAAE